MSESSSNFKDIAAELPLKDMYQDLAQPTARSVGQTVSLPFRIVNNLLSPVFKWVMRGEENLNVVSELVSEKLSDIPEEKLVPPEPYVAVPALQAISYSMDSKELREMYANLLAKAINSDEKDKVHPAYVEIIKQMSPLDAVALKHLQKGGRTSLPMCNIRWQDKSRPVWEDFPSFRVFNFGSTLRNHLFALNEDGFDSLDITISFENLDRLGLVRVRDDLHVDKTRYDLFMDPSLLETYSDLITFLPGGENRELAIVPGSAQITSLGQTFSSICLLDSLANPV